MDPDDARKAIGMFGLKVKKKKKDADLVLMNKGALDGKVEDSGRSELSGVPVEEPASPPVKRTRTVTPSRRSKLKTCIQDVEIKPQNFQVSINITEARQLVGDNIDPSVLIEIGDEKKQTSVKEGTNAPFYNEYFVFEFFAHQEVFFDKVIKISVVHSKMLRSVCVGFFKLDTGTVYKQPGHHFLNKWAVLSDPSDLNTGVKGYVKCDISVSGKGEAAAPGQKVPDAEEKIEKNLLLPPGFPSERPWARFCVKVYCAEGLPRNNSSIMANVTKAFVGDATALIDPYVVVRFFRQTGRTSTQKATADPVWNEQIVFIEMFPPLCLRMQIQVWDEGSMNDVAIGTHYLDLRRISNEQDGDRGFLPTFGPAWVNLYGSARNFSLVDDNPELNEGIGEGVSYRGRVYMELAVEFLSGGSGLESKVSRPAKAAKDTKKAPAGGVATGGGAEEEKGKAPGAEVTPVDAPHQKGAEKDSFLLFGTVFEASMIDRKIGDKPVSFEFSVGNYGNVLESPSQSGGSSGFPSDPSPSSVTSPLLARRTEEKGWPSCTPPEKPVLVEGNRFYMYLPLQNQKPCINVLSQWEDNTYRLHTSNMLENITTWLEEGLAKVAEMDRKLDPGAAPLLTTVLEEFCMDARSFIATVDIKLKEELKIIDLTQLDAKRLLTCKQELETMIVEAEGLVGRKRKMKTAGVKELLQEASRLTHKLHFLVEEPQHTVPDVFVWLLSNNKRVAHARVRARDLLYSPRPEERGRDCGKILSLFLKPPGRRVSAWCVQARLEVYLWLGPCAHSGHMLDNMPAGFRPATGGATLPTAMACQASYQFQLRCHMYQARGLIAADSSGLSDPFSRVSCMSHSLTTCVMSQTLSPTWNQCLVMGHLTLHGEMEQLVQEPPRVVIEVYDDDALGKPEYLGSTVADAQVCLLGAEPYRPPQLQYSALTCGGLSGGDLLAAFELLQVPEAGLKALPPLEEKEGNIYFSVPADIRPILSTYRLEVLFWGLRELRRVQLLTVDRPQVFIECAGHTLRSSVIRSYKSSPNFTTLVDSMELELPENENLHPPLSITVVDWRAFGRSTLVGSHTINNLKPFKYIPPPPQTPEAPQTPEPLQTAGPSQTAEPQSVQEPGTTVELPNQDTAITVEEDLPPPAPPTAPPTPTEEPKKQDQGRSTRRSTKRRRRTIADESAENVIDWWSKYFASVERAQFQIKQRDGQSLPQMFDKVSPLELLLSVGVDSLAGRSDGERKKKVKALEQSVVQQSLATLQLYDKELEAEFGPFDDWVKTFELFRGKANDEEASHEDRFVGKFKGRFCLYKLTKDEEEDAEGRLKVTRGIPPNSPFKVLVRVYIVSASNLHPSDPDGRSDPYIVLRLGKKEIKDRDNYVPKQLNPVFGRSFEFQAMFPQEAVLSVSIYDYDTVGTDDLIGETQIDLENRFYSRHRATCGLPTQFSLEGYNAWRDILKPSELLTRLCRDNRLDGPHFRPGRITVAQRVFSGKTVFMVDDEQAESYEHLSLKVLHRWAELPGGCRLVPEHIETRTLFHKARPGMDQGQLQMWVDMFPVDLPPPGPSVDISPRKPRGYELRIVIWNTEDVVLEDTNILTGQQSSDIYVRSWLKGLEEDKQETDVHYNSLTGEGNFNWRFVFPFNYLPAEKVVVVRKRESIFSLDQSEQKIPAILVLQVWDFERLSSDDFLGTVELDLHAFPRGAKSAKVCCYEMMFDRVDPISIFQQKRARGWWPVSKADELTGKVEAEFHLVTSEEAEKNPVGRARKEPEPLEKPHRPDTSFSWFVNPFKCFFHLIWRNYKKYIILALVLLVTVLFLALLIYTLPGAISQKIVNG